MFPSSRTVKGVIQVWVLTKKTQQLGSCICSYSAAQTPQGSHPGHEYIQDIWVNKNISTPEPNVNQPLLKSTEIKCLPVLRELAQAYTLFDPKQRFKQDVRCMLLPHNSLLRKTFFMASGQNYALPPLPHICIVKEHHPN